MDTILDAKRGVTSMHSSARALRKALGDFMAAHVRAYGRDRIKPKHHWMFDLIDQWLRHADVYDAFIIERLHLRCKAVANLVKNLRSYEVRAKLYTARATPSYAISYEIPCAKYFNAAAQCIRKPRAYKESVLAGLYSAHERSLRTPFAAGLAGAVGDLGDGIVAADMVVWHGLRIAVGVRG